MIPFDFNFREPDYVAVWEWRVKVLTKIRENDGLLDVFKEYYKNNPWDFVTHWGSTYDPRNVEVGLPTSIPFVLFPKQVEWCKFVVRKWKAREPGISEKSREVGLSWTAIGLSCSMCLFNDGFSIGFGSRKEEYIDKLGDPKSLFWKARMFMQKLPTEFRGGFDIKQHAPHMRLMFPETKATITGESGDNIGRGDRKSLYFVDEAAYIERPQLIDASLSATTNCRIDISSANGMGNSFAQRRHSGKIEVFTIHWRDDPRKDDAWYEKQCNELDPVTVAQEIDINYSASVEGIVIPNEWIQATVDACGKLGIEPTGATFGALDVADEGVDLNAFAMKKGVELFSVNEWSGKGSDTFVTCEKAFILADEFDCSQWQYDADGIGASIRGDARVINERRHTQQAKQHNLIAFRGSGEVIQPEKEMIKGRKNKDYFRNRKAQAWWSLRLRFQNTFRAVNGATDFDRDFIISISPKLKMLSKLLMELSQPTYSITTEGKILIDKSPDGSRSPNLADAVMMLYSPVRVTNSLFS